MTDASHPEAADLPKTRPLRVLIIEDSKPDSVLMLDELRQGGYEPEWLRVETVAALTTALDSMEWEVVIADYRLPQFTGLEALKLVQSCGRDVPFILVSGFIGEEQAAAVMKAGAQAFLLKDRLAQLAPVVQRELKDAENRRERRHAEERYHTLFETLMEGFCIIEVLFDANEHPVDCRFLEVNPAFEKQTGLFHAQGRSMRELVPNHEAYWFEIYGRVALTGEPERFVNEAKALHCWYDVHAYRVGGPSSRKVAILLNDITDRVRAEAALWRMRDELERRVQERTAELTRANESLLEALHLNEQISVERKLAEERTAQLARAKGILAGVDHAIVHLTDRQQLLDEICRVAVETGGFKLAWIGMVSADESVRPVAQAGATGYLDGIRVLVTPDEPEGRGPVGEALREQHPVVVEDIARDPRMIPWRDRALKFGLHYAAVFPIRVADQATGSFHVYAPHAGFFDDSELALLTQVSNDISFALTVMADNAARKVAEDRLRRSERNLTNFFEQAPIGLVWLSADGAILRANQAQLDLLGYSQTEYVGHAFIEFCAEPANCRELLRRLGARETVRNFPMKRRCQDGSIRHVLVDANSFWSGNEFQYSSVFVRDITDRVQLEREILQAGEREQRRIAQDLHDGLGQLLAGTAYLTGTLQKKLASSDHPEAPSSGRILEAINEAIDQTRGLARGLHPVAAEPNGLMAALETLVARTQELFQVHCHFECPKPVLIHDNAVATHLYRIAQEAVTNAIKHGKSGRINISLTEMSGRMQLEIKDDGVGESARSEQKPGMGMRIMRYRAGMIGGFLTVQHEAGGGTAVVCTAPLSSTEVPDHRQAAPPQKHRKRYVKKQSSLTQNRATEEDPDRGRPHHDAGRSARGD